jgi:hypothetical protein
VSHGAQGTGKAAAGSRRNAKTLIARLELLLETGDVLMEEADDRALAVVVKRRVRSAVVVDSTHSSQMVVAPRSTITNNDGSVSWNSSS